LTGRIPLCSSYPARGRGYIVSPGCNRRCGSDLDCLAQAVTFFGGANPIMDYLYPRRWLLPGYASRMG